MAKKAAFLSTALTVLSIAFFGFFASVQAQAPQVSVDTTVVQSDRIETISAAGAGNNSCSATYTTGVWHRQEQARISFKDVSGTGLLTGTVALSTTAGLQQIQSFNLSVEAISYPGKILGQFADLQDGNQIVWSMTLCGVKIPDFTMQYLPAPVHLSPFFPEGDKGNFCLVGSDWKNDPGLWAKLFDAQNNVAELVKAYFPAASGRLGPWIVTTNGYHKLVVEAYNDGDFNPEQLRQSLVVEWEANCGPITVTPTLTVPTETPTPTTVTETPTPTTVTETGTYTLYLPLVNKNDSTPTPTPTSTPEVTPVPWKFVGCWQDCHAWTAMFEAGFTPVKQAVPSNTWSTSWGAGEKVMLQAHGHTIVYRNRDFSGGEIVENILIDGVKIPSPPPAEINLGDIVIFDVIDRCYDNGETRDCHSPQIFWRDDTNATGLLPEAFNKIAAAQAAQQ